MTTGAPSAILKQEDFHVFEDGKEQQICAFSHEELPLAVALVVDNSSSIAAALEELRAGALDTLALLKPDRPGGHLQLRGEARNGGGPDLGPRGPFRRFVGSQPLWRHRPQRCAV